MIKTRAGRVGVTARVVVGCVAAPCAAVSREELQAVAASVALAVSGRNERSPRVGASYLFVG